MRYVAFKLFRRETELAISAFVSFVSLFVMLFIDPAPLPAIFSLVVPLSETTETLDTLTGLFETFNCDDTFPVLIETSPLLSEAVLLPVLASCEIVFVTNEVCSIDTLIVDVDELFIELSDSAPLPLIVSEEFCVESAD